MSSLIDVPNTCIESTGHHHERLTPGVRNKESGRLLNPKSAKASSLRR
jgi:hypothetical protein